jgi:ubiquinone/menaquinone biosynthesis C-methylase UbiE
MAVEISAHLERWNSVFTSRPWGRYPSEDLVRFIARTFGTVKDKNTIRVLDIGCGTGSNLWFLARDGYSISGIDGSEEAVRQSKDRIIAEGLSDKSSGLDIKIGNFESLTWPDNSFDAVVNLDAISANKLSVIENCVHEIHRVLKPGGYHFGKMFSSKTTGWDTGKFLADGTNVNPTEGPCKDLGFCYFLDEEKIESLFSNFSDLRFDKSFRTDIENNFHIHKWLVRAKK